jgi:transposase-like protein
MKLSPYELIRRFPDEESARVHLECARWNSHATCPNCGYIKGQIKQTRSGVKGYYRCSNCLLTYTIRTGTLFERSHVSLDKWLIALYQVHYCPRKISPTCLSRNIDVTEKTARLVLKKIRDLLAQDNNHFIKTHWDCLFDRQGIVKLRASKMSTTSLHL